MVAFLCSSSLTTNGRPVSPLYDLPQLHGMSYMQFFVCSLVVGGLTFGFVSDLRRVVVLLNTVLMLYVPQIHLSFSDSPLLYGMDTVVIGLSRAR